MKVQISVNVIGTKHRNRYSVCPTQSLRYPFCLGSSNDSRDQDATKIIKRHKSAI